MSAPGSHQRTRRWFLRAQLAADTQIRGDGFTPTATQIALKLGMDRGTYRQYVIDYGGISATSTGLSGRELQELDP